MFNSPTYKTAAQAAMRTYNSQCKDNKKKYKKRSRGSDFVDPLADAFSTEDATIWTEMEIWLQANISTVYFHRIVDTHAPSLHLVYYCSCLVDKHLRHANPMFQEHK